MTNATPTDPQRLEELLAGKALEDLSPEEGAELENYLAERPDAAERLAQLEATAAAADLAFGTQVESAMPETLRDRIRQQAPQHLANARGVSTTVRPADSMMGQDAQKRGLQVRELFAWVGLAASLLLAVGLWRSGQDRLGPDPTLPQLSDAELRERLLAEAVDTVRVAWTAGPTPFDQPVQGDVVWSNSRQRGYLRFQGMPINDPAVEQYQLWIIDPARDEEPIDGGVFDVAAEGEVIVPIDAKLRVLDPEAFAITIEQPGGVVVSTQDRLPLLAPLPE